MDRDEAVARHREIAEAHVVSRRVEEESEEEEEEEDEEAIEARRAAIRERWVTTCALRESSGFFFSS